jgi:acyl-coenzyme A thioesterase PaaI-like protein
VESRTSESAYALKSVARTRAFGMHFFGHFLGISTTSSDGKEATLHLGMPFGGGDMPGGEESNWMTSPTALATLADLGLSAAIRKELGPNHRLGTVTLGIHLVDTLVRGPVTALSTPRWGSAAEGHGYARSDLYGASGQLVGIAEGWFVVLPVPDGVKLPPPLWEGLDLPAVPQLSPEDLNSDESSCVSAAARAIRRSVSKGTPLAEELLDIKWSGEEGADLVKGETRLGPEHANRVGHVQGGATYGAAAAAAARVAGPGTRLVDGRLQYLTPAEGPILITEARVLRRGKRATFVGVEVLVEDRLVAAGHFAFGP